MKRLSWIIGLGLILLPLHARAANFKLGAFLSYTEQQEQSLDMYGRHMTDISVYGYGFDSNDNLIPASPWVTSELQKLMANPVAGRKVYATIVNEFETAPGTVYSVDLLVRILRNPTERTRHIQQLVAISQTVDGIDIDYEPLTYESGFVDITDDLTAFYRDLRAALPPGKVLVTDLMVKYDLANPTHALGAQAYDWTAIAPYVDFIRPMLYEFHGSWSGPGPQSSPSDVQNSLTYEINHDRIPANKIQGLFNTFSWDWDLVTGGAVLIEYGAAMAIVQSGATVSRDAASQALVIHYADPNHHAHEVWMDDSVTYQAKIATAMNLGVNQFSIFYLGSGDPAGWEWMATQVAAGKPLLFQLTPDVLVAHTAGQPLSLRGANFNGSSQALWNGISRTTTLLTASTATFNVPSTDLLSPGIAGISLQTSLGTSNTLSLPIKSTPFVPIRINCGGRDYTDNHGQLWSGDTDFDNGIVNSNNNDIANTDSPTLYRSERYSPQPFKYTFDVPVGSYTVTLKFAEITWTKPGSRIFNVSINGTTVLNHFDIVATSGPNTAVDRTFSVIVATGPIQITFSPISPQKDNPKISAIEILAQKPPQPVITSVSPSGATTGGDTFNLTVLGDNFVDGSVLQWNTVTRATSLIAPGTLLAVISAQDIATPGTVQLTVANPDPDTDPSASVPYTIGGGLIAPFTLDPPRNLFVYENQRASFHFDVGGSRTLAFQWQMKSPGAAQFVPVSGSQSTDTFSISTATVAMNGAQVRCLVTNSVGSLLSPVAILTVFPNPGTFVPLRIHAGGGDYTDDLQQIWYADTNFTGGTTYSSTHTIANTTTPTLYRTGRQGAGDFQYSFDAPNGMYTLLLKFAEVSPIGVGGRVFSVDANGQPLLSNFDVVAAAGGANTAVDETFTVAAVNGKLVVHFTPVHGLPIVSALSVVSSSFIPPVLDPIPAIDTISPASIVAGSSDTLLTVTGSSMVATSVVTWNDAALQTVFISSTEIQATVPAALLISSGSAQVRIYTAPPGGGTSQSRTFTITQAEWPAPTLSDMSTYSVPAGGADVTFDVFGSSFVVVSSVTWNGISIPTVYISSTDLRATIPGAYLVFPGSATIRVFTDVPGGGTSHSLTMTLFQPDSPAPFLIDLSLFSAPNGSPDTTFDVLGSSFVSVSSVTWNGTALPTVFISSGDLRATIPAALLVSTGTASIRVFTPAPGGGTSQSRTFTIFQADYPAPVLLDMSLFSAQAGSPDTVFDVFGSSFATLSSVTWNGAALPTVFINSSDLQATIPAALLVSSGSAQVRVFTPAPGGGTTQSRTFTIIQADWPAPVLLDMSLFSIQAGNPDTTFDVFGSSFVSVSSVTWNGATLPTVFISGGDLRATIPAALLVSSGSAQVRVFTPAPGGGTSQSRTFAIAQGDWPVPDITTLSQFSAQAGSPDTVFDVLGSSFTPVSSVTWNGTALQTVFINGDDLQATIPAPLLISSGTAQIRVFTPVPGGGISQSRTFTITQIPWPAPILTDLGTHSTFVGHGNLTLQVFGSNFVGVSSVTWNDLPVETSFVSGTELDALIPAVDFASSGTAQVRVFTPAPGGDISQSLTFTINLVPDNPAPVLLSLSKNSADRGDAGFILTVTGTGFSPTSTIQWNNSPRATTFLSDQQLSATILDSDLGVEGSAMITVFTPLPGGGLSNSLTFTVKLIPLLQRWSPISIQAGGSAFELQLIGSNFSPNAVALWAGQSRPIRYVSDGEIWASLQASDIATAGSYSLAVLNPAPGGMSGVETISVVAAPSQPAAVGITDLAGVRAYPNPWRADRASSNAPGGITFDSLPNGSTIKIFSISGRWLQTLSAPAGQAVWDLRNDHGDAAASGYYLFSIEDPAGHRSRGKLMLIR